MAIDSMWNTMQAMNIIRAAHINVHIIQEWLEYKEDSAAEKDHHHQERAGVLPHHIPKLDLPIRYLGLLVNPDVVKIPT